MKTKNVTKRNQQSRSTKIREPKMQGQMLPNQPIISNQQENPEDDKPKRGATNSFWKVVGDARTMYNYQLQKSNELKRQCIENYMPGVYRDQDKFWAEYMEQENRMLDRRTFERECEALGYNPYFIAEHVVFLGGTAVAQVLKDGVQKTLGQDVLLYNDGRFTGDKGVKFLVDIKNDKYPHPSTENQPSAPLSEPVTQSVQQ